MTWALIIGCIVGWIVISLFWLGVMETAYEKKGKKPHGLMMIGALLGIGFIALGSFFQEKVTPFSFNGGFWWFPLMLWVLGGLLSILSIAPAGSLGGSGDGEKRDKERRIEHYDTRGLPKGYSIEKGRKIEHYDERGLPKGTSYKK